MNSPIDYRKYLILFVDDEEKTRKYFRLIFGSTFQIVEAADGVEALEVFEKHADDIALVVTDQRMPRESGSDFLAKVAQRAPDVVKILSTAYSDLDAAITSVNEGGIYHYLTKPWDVPQVEVILRRAMEFFHVKRQRDEHFQMKLQALGHVVMAGRMAAFALIPVATGADVRGAAEAIATAVRLGALGLDQAGCGALPWQQVLDKHAALARQLSVCLPRVLSTQGLELRVQGFKHVLDAVTDGGWSLDGLSLRGPHNPFQALLTGWIQGGADAMRVEQAADLLAGLFAICDAGGRVQHIRDDAAFAIDINPVGRGDNEAEEAVKWIFNDSYLMASAIGLD